MEPYRLRRWKRRKSATSEPIFTCARPGRSNGPHGKVSDQVVRTWLKGLPGQQEAPISILSMLGEKPDGTSEWSFYSFADSAEFEKWILGNTDRDIKVFSHPTIDFSKVSAETASAICTRLVTELDAGRIAVIVDSGGMQRTNQVCRMIGLQEDPTGWKDI